MDFFRSKTMIVLLNIKTLKGAVKKQSRKRKDYKLTERGRLVVFFCDIIYFHEKTYHTSV